ncbi:hypothetical protein N7539_007684 [Penicillium diatomitis]|uniref:ER membrane protein complex subunit 6 n=1 Tax=Penicillium diatomitis TaxID=2819901 RepID=A0A9W9WVK8_9EURO|nr:uncharacterized protein N7539_007684 [Penicillium diatomitis]KAJ5477540.1 hypothetical protein N7539_007684 [Penicillium diatomitis]
MAPTKAELSLLINPLVPEAVQHNNRVLSSLHSLTAFLLGLSAGILALQSTTGFAFYFAGTVLVSALFHVVILKRSSGAGAGAYFPGSSGGEIEGQVRMEGSAVRLEKGGKKGGLYLAEGRLERCLVGRWCVE